MKGANPTSPGPSPVGDRHLAVGAPTATVSVIVPTYNEAENIETVIDRLTSVLTGHDYEIIVVDDDSPDGTWRLVADRASSDDRVRVVRRLDRRGLSSAILDGMETATGSVLAVLDADLQHDEAVLPAMVSAVHEGEADVCIGSRGAPGGSYGEFGPLRRSLSFGGALLARLALGVDVTDPMSGYFVVSRQRFEAVRHRANPRGFKILLDLLVAGPRPRVAEVGYRFRARRRGETKLTARVMGSYLVALAELAIGRTVSRTFVAYVAVALTALSLRLSLASMGAIGGLPGVDPLVAIELAVLGEYLGHRHITFATGAGPAPGGLGRLAWFHLVALNGVLAQLGLATVIDELSTASTSAPALIPMFGVSTTGVLTLLVVAYVLNRQLTWGDR